jgi:precorrin-4 methylase
MTLSVFEGSARLRAPLIFRPALHSIDDIVHALIPFYGPRCPISAHFKDSSPKGSRIDATLGTIVNALPASSGSREPTLVIG